MHVYMYVCLFVHHRYIRIYIYVYMYICMIIDGLHKN